MIAPANNALTMQQPLIRMRVFTFALFFVLAGGITTLPTPAFAYYYDYDTANTAQQELATPGDPIPGAAIPDGVYLVGARTSSRMCILYPTAEDCDANTNREMCYVAVEGGNITAVFYTSKAYTRLCMGTGEYAASLSDSSGTNDAPYMVGDPAEGYVPHLYTFPVNALNEPIVFAAFSGGNRSVEESKWYTRTVIFTPTEDVMNAIKGGGSSSNTNQEQEPTQEENNQSSSPSDGQSNQTPAAATTTNGNSDNGSGGSDGGAEEQATDQSQEAESGTTQAADASANATAKKRGIPITIAELGVPDVLFDVQQVEAVDTSPKGLTQTQILGLLIIAGVIAGCLARVFMFVKSKRERV